jgi:GNAT superfamily N-acetyltransferase
VRIAELGDAAELTSLINRAFAVERFFIEGDRLDVEEVRTRLGTGQFLVLEDGEGTAGSVYVELRGDRAYLGLLAVDPARQRQGIGRRMVAAAEELARQAGCRHMDLRIVNLREELPPFYRALGYVETGTSPFPAEQPVKAACYFVEMSKYL